MTNKSDRGAATAAAVAAWMLTELEKHDGVLYQDDAASQIEDLFGEEFVYDGDSGNSCIGKDVLLSFRKITGDAVVWVRGERLWRRRELSDEPTRLQE